MALDIAQDSPQASALGPPASPVLTLVIPCKGRLAHLRQSLPRLLKQTLSPARSADWLQCIVVDYNCPERCGDWVRHHHPGVRVAQVPQVDDFNPARARNAGGARVTTPWIGFVDADVLVQPGFLASVLPQLLGREAHKPVLLAPAGTYDLGGFVICPTHVFHAVGGYDETFEGWGSEDRDFRQRLIAFGGLPEVLPVHLFNGISHSDAERTRFHALRDRFVSLRINALYLQAKTDLARQRGILQISESERAHLYAQVKAAVLAHPQSPTELTLTLPPSQDITLAPGWQLSRQWVYRLAPDGA